MASADGIFDRAAVLDAVTAALDQIGRDVAIDRQKRDRQQDALLRENERLTAQIEGLQREQAALKEQLARAQAARQGEGAADAGVNGRRPDDRRDARQPLGELSSNATTPQRGAPEKPKARRAPAIERASTPGRTGTKQQIVDMLERAKKNEKRWMKYAEILEEQLGSKVGSGAVIRRHRPTLEACSGASRASSEPRSPAPGLPADARSSEPSPRHDKEDATPEPNTTEHETDGADDDAELPPRPKRGVPADGGKYSAIKQEPLSDGPVFVSARSVGKRKLPDDDAVNLAPVRRLKTEETGSDPAVGDAPHYSPQESMDLDETGRPEMPTPKKLRQLPPARPDAPADKEAEERRRNEFVPSQGVPFGIKSLDNLLDGAPSARKKQKPLLTPPARRAGNRADAHHTAERGNDTKQQKSAPEATNPTKPHAPDSRRPDRPTGGRGPLRGLPLNSLRLDDFKPNPKTTDGVLHVYNDVVRGKAERASLAGCTDRNCPGGKDWRSMAMAELKAAGPSLVGKPDSVKLMEQFLGDDCYKLGRMTCPEKEGVWLDARTWETANKYGRCRHRFPRPPTPEQYWDTDFPSTQDRARDKAEGERTERAIIEQRYREAMRKGGRWLFKDE